MSRSLVAMREATLADVELLAELWQPFLRRGTADEPLQRRRHRDRATRATDRASGSWSREYDGGFAGAVFLKAAAYSPVNSEPVLQVHNLARRARPPPARHRQGAAGVLRSPGPRSSGSGTSRPRPRPAPARPTASWRGSRSGRRPCCGSRRPAPCAPSSPSRQSAGRQVTQVLAARRSLRSSRSVAGREPRRGQPGTWSSGSSAQVIRQVQTRRSRSSVITIS